MKEKNIVQLVKNRDIQTLGSVVFIYGTENLLKKQLIDILKEKSDKDIHIFWGDELEISELLEVFSGGSLFSAGNIAVIFEADAFLEKVSKKELQLLKSILEKVKSSSDSLVFVSNKEKVPSKEPYKSIVSAGDTVVSNKLTPKAFVMSLKKKIQSYGKGIDDDTVKYLAGKLKNSLEYAKQEVEKLILYVQDKEKIEKSDIDAIITPKLEENIFSFIADFFTKKKSAVFSLKNLLETGYHPFEIQGLILFYINKLLVVLSYMENGYTVEEGLDRAGIKHPAQKGIYKKILSVQSRDSLIELLKDLYNLEKSQKVYFEDIEKKLENFIVSHIYS